jgi:hypothetical protein
LTSTLAFWTAHFCVHTYPQATLVILQNIYFFLKKIMTKLMVFNFQNVLKVKHDFLAWTEIQKGCKICINFDPNCYAQSYGYFCT